MLFVLRVVAGACVGRWTGQPRMPPRERQHEGFLVLWGGVVAVWTEGVCGGEVLTTGVVRHACRHRVDGTPPCGGAGEEVFGFVGGRCCRLF